MKKDVDGGRRRGHHSIVKTPHRYVLQGLNGPAELRIGENNDCAVRALAVATGYSYNDCHAFFELHGREPRKGTFCYRILAGDLASRLETSFPELGFKAVRCGGYVKPTLPAGSPWISSGITLRSFCRARPTGAYFITVARHALAVVDGVIYDFACRDLRRVCDVWRIERIS